MPFLETTPHERAALGRIRTRNALLPAIEIRPHRFESLDKITRMIYHYQILEMSVSEVRK